MRKRVMRDRRGAFTLIELIVVIAIIAALMALSASAVLKYLGTQQEGNTKSTLNKTQSQLTKAWSKVKDTAYKETIPAAYLPGLQGLAGNDANATGRVRVLYVKLKLRQAFPMNFDEALNLATANTGGQQSPLPGLPAYKTYLNSLGISGSSVPPAAYESSACLLMALQRGVSGAGINAEDLTAGGAAHMAGSLPYLADAWGQPIYFSRFPTGSPILNPNGAQAGANDPGDPQGYLQMASWGSQFGGTFQALTQQQLAPANSSYRLAPMVASSGADKTLFTNPITFAPLPAVTPAQRFQPNGTFGDDLFSNP